MIIHLSGDREEIVRSFIEDGRFTSEDGEPGVSSSFRVIRCRFIFSENPVSVHLFA